MADGKPTLLDWLGLNREPDYSKARWLGVILSGLAFALIVSVFGFTLYQFIEAIAGLDTFETPESQSAAIRNTGLVLAAIIGIPFVVWRSVVAQKQVDVAEQGQITDRINKAVEGLGAEKTVSRIGRVVQVKAEDGRIKQEIKWAGQNLKLQSGDTVETDKGEWQVFNETLPNLEVRIGAVYALERIAQDSDRDHVQIMEILCAYIRANAPSNQAETCPEHWIVDKTSGIERRHPTPLNIIANWVKSLRPPRSDIQTVLTVIGRRTRHQISLEGNHVNGRWQGYQLDLKNTCLQQADLTNCNFCNANFEGSRLQGANLSKSLIKSANFWLAQLHCARFSTAQLQGAHFGEVPMQMSDLSGAWAHGADFSQA